MDGFKGAGWYRIAFSDGGMNWTNDGPIWIEDQEDYDDEMKAAEAVSSEFHLPYSEYLGCDEDGPRRYRVLVEYEDGDSWDKAFDDAHESLEYYKGCSNMRILLRDDATVKAQRLDDGEWVTVFRSEVKGSDWL